MVGKVLQYPKGSIITFTTGEYSDFRVCGFVVTIVACNLPKLAQEYGNGKKLYSEDGEPSDFPSWLIANGHVMPVEHSEVHLGAYGIWEGEFGVTQNEED